MPCGPRGHAAVSMDAQTIVDTVVALDETTALAIVTSILQSRPELAPPLVSYAVPDLTYPPSKAMTERRSHGRVKSINSEKGYGFIECQELHEVFGNDVFLHMKQAGDLSQGTMVSFAVMLNKENRPQAYDVLAEGKGFGCGKGGCGMMGMQGKSAGGGDPSGFNANSMMAMMKGAWGGKMGSAGGDGKGKGDGKSFSKGARPDEQEALGEFDGTIKSFNPKSGYGFIECEDLRSLGCMNDVFLHHQQLGDHEVGARVRFTAYMNSKGQPQGKDLKPAGFVGFEIPEPAPKKVKLSW